MTFSLTAPMISEEVEAAEKAALTEEERRLIYQDIHGPSSSASSSSEPIWRVNNLKHDVELVQEAISLMKDRDTSDYNQALQQVPALVQTESNVVDFLRYDNGNAQAAAKRIVDYWKVRREVFGVQRAFRPMTLDGAMLEDQSVLQTGVITILPPDQHGRPVLFVKRSELTSENGSRQAFARCFFYLYSIIAASQEGKNNGFVFITYVKDGNLFKLFNRWLVKRNVAAYNAMPLTSRCVHIVNRTPNKTLRKLLLPAIKHMMGKHNRQRLQIHSGDEQRVVLPALESYGIVAKGLPEDLGGELVGQEYAEGWLREQSAQERAASALLVARRSQQQARLLAPEIVMNAAA